MLEQPLHNVPSVDLPSIHELAKDMPARRGDVLSVARIDFGQMIDAAGASSVVAALIEHFRIADASMRDIIKQSSPFFLRAHDQWMERPGGLRELNRLVDSGGPQQFADGAGLVDASVSRQEGQTFLKYLFVDDEALETVTQQIASGIEMAPQALGEMMPNLAALFVGVLCKSMTPFSAAP